MQSEILAEVVRGETVESVHRGHLIVVDGAGAAILSKGDPETVTFIRSSGKPFQAFPVLTSGAAERFGFSDLEIALACGSHSGEKIHTETCAKMLGKINLSETDLRCGAQIPFNEKLAEQMMRDGEKPNQLHNNCSGKHAAMLALARHLGADLKTYEALANPVQQTILDTVSLFTDIPKNAIPIGIDGCAAPNFAMPVSTMAKSFARLIFPPKSFDTETREACRRIVSAMMTYPEMIGGEDRLDTIIMQSARGRIISKIGAEGVYTAGVLPSERWKKGLGIAVKIEDGDDKRARVVVIIELLRVLGVIDETNDRKLREYSPLAIKNRRGDTVGQIRSVNLDLVKDKQ